MSFFNNLTIFFSIFITSYLTFIDAANITILNNCSDTIWAVAYPGGGMQLSPTEKWGLYTDPNFKNKGRIWARTNCGVNKCEREAYGVPVTLVEYTINVSLNLDFFDISLINGFNVPVEFSPTNSTCSTVKCSADINRLCPTELRDPGGCLSPCAVFNNSQFCCTGTNSTPSTCGPTPYSKFFKDACPNVCTYAYDDATSTFTCLTGTGYNVVFCP